MSAVTDAIGGVHGFPAVLTSFVGRAGSAREVAGLLGEYRLVTLTGPGGVGKTRLAGQVARAVAARFADGAWLAELAGGVRRRRCRATSGGPDGATNRGADVRDCVRDARHVGQQTENGCGVGHR